MESTKLQFRLKEITLNSQQAQIVKYEPCTNIRILASAGSGKTTTITTRIAYLIQEHKIREDSIFLTTFSRNASDTMKERIEGLIGNTRVYVGTFHALANRILRAYDPDSLKDLYRVDELPNKFLDFIISEKGRKWVGKLHHIIIDEFQDVNEVQYEIMKRLQKRFDNHWQGRVPWETAEGEEDTLWLNDLVRTTEHYQRWKKTGLKDAAIFERLAVPRKMTVFNWKGDEEKLMSPLDSVRYYLQILQGGLLAEDPFTGGIKVWVGGINFNHFKYDHVKQSKRQPGSTFKPFVYAAAIEKGNYGPCDKITDKPVTHKYREINPKTGQEEDMEWSPRNADWNFSFSEYTLRRGMAKSVNSIAAQLTIIMTPQEVAKTAKAMGISSPLKEIPSIGLGANDVSLFELVGAYATILNKGEWIEPHMVSRVEDMDGKVIFDYKPEKRRALTEETAFLMTYMLRGGTEEHGGTSQALFEFDIFWRNEIGGKTGTSQNYSDGWFVGMTKDLVLGSWVGADQRRVHFRNSQTGEGSKTALPIAGRFLELLYKDEMLERGAFPQPTVPINKAWACRTVLPKVDSTATDSLIVMPEESLIPDN
jgi:penicillin-binding protein 1A